MKHSKLAILSIVGVAILGVTACSGASGESGSGDSEALKIGVALPSGSEVYWTGYQNGAKNAAKELGVEVVFTDAKNDAQTMNDQVNSLIVSGVDGITAAPVNSEANTAIAQAATDANIPLITGNRTLDSEYGGVGGANPILHAGFDDYAIGGAQAELLVQACDGIDPCNVIQEVGTLGSSAQIDRQAGMEDGLKSESNIHILATQPNDFDPTKAADVTQALLQAHPEANFVTTQEDPTAIAVIKVLEEQGLNDDVKVIGIGGTKDGNAAIEAGTMFGSVQVSSNIDGATAVQAIVDLVNGVDIETEDIGDRPTVPVPFTILTSENVADHPGDW